MTEAQDTTLQTPRELEDMGRSVSIDGVNGMRTLELGSALNWLKDQLATRLRGGSQTISTIGCRTKEEQEIVGMGQILFVMFPFVIELALKSLKGYLDAEGKYDPIHKLDDLFSSLIVNARDKSEAETVQNEARDFWKQLQGDGRVSFSGTLEEFLAEHSTDFINFRYYEWSNLSDTAINDFMLCYYSILAPLITRDQKTAANFRNLFPSLRSR